MAITSVSVTVGTASVLLAQAKGNGCTVHIYSGSGGQDVTIGGTSAITASQGYVVPTGKTTDVIINLPPGDALYGITASSTHALKILIVEY